MKSWCPGCGSRGSVGFKRWADGGPRKVALIKDIQKKARIAPGSFGSDRLGGELFFKDALKLASSIYDFALG